MRDWPRAQGGAPSRRLKLLLYALSLMSLSLSPHFVRWAQEAPELIGAWRLGLTALILAPFALRSAGSWSELGRQTRQGALLLSGVFFFLHLWTYFYAAQNTRIAHCMILFSTNPLFVAAGNWILFRERPTWTLGLGYLLAFAGLALLLHHSFSFEQGLLLGDLSALLSAFLFAIYILAGKKTRLSTPNRQYAFGLNLIAGSCFILLSWAQGQSPLPEHSRFWVGIAGLIVFPTLLGHTLFSWLMTRMDLNLMTCGKLIEPVLASALAWWIYHEQPSTTTFVAFALTSSAVLILFWPHLKRGTNSLP